MKIKLTKVSRPEGLDGGLRTPSVVGETDSLPTIGRCFEMTGKPLDPTASIRCVNTSKVMAMSSAFTEQSNTIFTLKTQSGSVYTVEVTDPTPSEPKPLQGAFVISIGA